MDERAEIWIARDPETNTLSKPVSLRKLRKGVQIGRLKPATLITRMGSTEWITLERLLADAALIASRVIPPPATDKELSTSIGPPPGLPTEPPPPTLTPPPAPVLPPTPTPPPALALTPTPLITAPLPIPVRASPDESSSLTAQWFLEPPPEPGDDEPIFQPQASFLDLRFEHVGALKLVRVTYVLMLLTLAGAVLVSIIRVFGAIADGEAKQIATAIAMVPVVALACAVLGAAGRLMLEVLLTLSRIAERLSTLTRAQR